MYTALILAGGLSTRMGFDKAFLRGGVRRICNELRAAGCHEIIVLCGSIDRMEFFNETCWADPENAQSLSEVISWAVSKIQGDVQLISCDAFAVNQDFFRAMRHGVPLDHLGKRQPLLARFNTKQNLNQDLRIEKMFENLKSVDLGKLAILASNVNTLDEFNEMKLFLEQNHQ